MLGTHAGEFGFRVAPCLASVGVGIGLNDISGVTAKWWIQLSSRPGSNMQTPNWACLGSPCLPSPCSTPPQFLSAPLVLILYHPQTRAEGGLVLKKQRKCLYPGKYFALKESLRIIRCEASRRSRNCWQFRNKKLYSVDGGRAHP